MSKVYSFALKPEDHQPSGICDFNKINGKMQVYTYVTDPVTKKIKFVPLDNLNCDSLISAFEKLNIRE